MKSSHCHNHLYALQPSMESAQSSVFLTPAQQLLHDQLLQKSEQLQDTIRRQQEELRQITQQLAQSQGPPQPPSILAMQNPGKHPPHASVSCLVHLSLASCTCLLPHTHLASCTCLLPHAPVSCLMHMSCLTHLTCLTHPSPASRTCLASWTCLWPHTPVPGLMHPSCLMHLSLASCTSLLPHAPFCLMDLSLASHTCLLLLPYAPLSLASGTRARMRV